MQIFYKLITSVTLFISVLVLNGCENYAERTHKSWVPPPSTPIYDDSTIFAHITSAVQSDSLLQGSQIDIKVNDGIVTLSGIVNSEDQLTRINMHAWIVDGVKKVDNQIIRDN